MGWGFLFTPEEIARCAFVRTISEGDIQKQSCRLASGRLGIGSRVTNVGSNFF